MSERRQRGQADQFKHQQDCAFEEDLKREHLFSKKPEIYSQKFRCSPTQSSDTSPLSTQDKVLLLPRKGTIDVAFNSLIVGHIEGGLDIINEALASEPRAGSILKAVVCRPPGLSGNFEVRISE